MQLRVALLGLALLGAVATETANVEFDAIRANMHDARTHGDWRTFRTGAERLVQFLNGSPDALVDLARGQARTGDSQGALATLKTIALMGESPDAVKTLVDFASLRSTAGFAAVSRLMEANETPQRHGKLVVEIPDAGFLPEDVDYDRAKGTFYLTSILENRIAKLARDGRLTTFARSPDGWPMLAIKLDRRNGVVWATESAVDGFAGISKADWGRSALLSYDYGSGRLLQRIECASNCNLGDMALAPNGDLLIADSEGGRLYVHGSHGNALRRIDRGDFLSPQTPAYVSRARALVPDYVRGIALVDLSTGDAQWLPMNGQYALQGIDGMYVYRDRLIAVQNGTSPERVASFTLASGFNRMASASVLERGIPDLDPTHGVVAGAEFYFIENSGWNALDDTGKVRQGASLTKARIVVTTLDQ